MEFEARCRGLLPELEREAFGASFHVAALDSPTVLSAWDSAHVALAFASVDPTLAAAELRALYGACQRENGLVASERAASPADRERRVAAAGPLFGEDERSILIAPPVAAYAAARLALGSGGSVRDLLACATRELDAIWGERLPPDTPLPVILHPLESGAARNPLADALFEPEDDEEYRDESATLLRSAAACQLDPERALRVGHPFVIEDPTFCGWLLLALEEAAAAWERLGDASACRKLRIRAEMIAEGIAARLFWDEQEIYAAWNRGRQSPLRAVTAGGLVPAAARALAEEGSPKRAIDRHLRPATSALWSSRGLYASEPPRRADDEAEPTRAPVELSPLAHFWAHLVLVRADRPADARVARNQLEALVTAHGLLPSFAARAPDVPEPAVDVALWPALALEMRDAERRAR